MPYYQPGQSFEDFYKVAQAQEPDMDYSGSQWGSNEAAFRASYDQQKKESEIWEPLKKQEQEAYAKTHPPGWQYGTGAGGGAGEGGGGGGGGGGTAAPTPPPDPIGGAPAMSAGGGGASSGGGAMAALDRLDTGSGWTTPSEPSSTRIGLGQRLPQNYSPLFGGRMY